MIPALVVEEAEKVGAQFLYNKGALQSIKPAESLFGYSYFAHMVPPFKPDHTAMLGYGGGTVAELMRKIWGPSKVTGVDIEINGKYNEYRMKQMDAREFLKDCTESLIKKRFDYICIDLWDGAMVPDFVFEAGFVAQIRQMATKLVSMNIHEVDVPRVRPYFDGGFKFDRAVPVEGNRIMWWSVQ